MTEEQEESASSSPSFSILERRRLNIQRNEELLQRLGLLFDKEPKPKQPQKKRERERAPEEAAVLPIKRRGMLLPRPQINKTTTCTSSKSLSSILQKYPYRSRCIRLLHSLLIDNVVTTQYIHCCGPPGTGKSTVLREILQQQSDPVAWISCHAMDSIHDLAHNIFHQLVLQLPNNDAPSRSLNSITALGYALKENFLRNDTTLRWIVVLDHADALVPHQHQPTLLSSLLELPHTFGLPLTFVSTSHNQRLWDTSFLGLSTLQGAFQPIKITFEAYTLEQLTTILHLPSTIELIFGSSDASASAQMKFLDQVIQLFQGLSTNLSDWIHLGRGLWRQYLSQKSPHSSSTTLITLEEFFRSTEILSRHICNPFNPICRHSPTTSDETAVSHLPLASKFFILSAYLCQTNRTTEDQTLFAQNQKQRKRRNKGNYSNEDDDPSDDVAVPNDGVGTLRQKTFQLERLLSVLVGLIRLNDHEDRLSRHIGGEMFLDVIRNLTGNQAMRMNTTGFFTNSSRFACAVTETEAEAIAKSLNIDLNSYRGSRTATSTKR